MQKLFLSIFIILVSNSINAETSNSELHPKTIVSEIVKHDPFPHKETKTRWTLDKDNSLDLEKDNETNEIAKHIIVFIAAISEYILWILIVAGVILVYINRKLFLFENIKSLKFNRKPPSIQTEQHEASINIDNILSDAQDLYDQGKTRESVKLLYNAFIKQVNDMQINVSANLTEKEIYTIILNLDQSILTQLTEKIINLRNKTAYQKKSFDRNDLISVCTQWAEVFSNEN